MLPFAIRVIAIAAALGIALPDPADARAKHRRGKPSAAAEQRSRAPASSEQWRTGYAAFVVDANTGKVLHESAPDALRHPASITKIMTLYMLFEQLEAGRLKLDSQLPVSARASAQEPTKLGLKPGSTIEVEDAIKALVTKSANDAAVVIAEAVGGDEASFATLMTRKARALGMSRTTFKNASGLPNPEQVTTARDLSVLGRAIQERFPRYYRYFSTRQFVWRGGTIANHNKLLGRVEGVDGIKTGYTRASGFNLVTSAKRNGRHIVGVVLGGRSGASRDAQMANLIETCLPKAYAGAPMVARIAEVEPATPIPQPEPRPMSREPLALAAVVVADQTPTAAISRPAPGSTEPLRPTTVRSVPVGPVTNTAPLGAVVVRASANSVSTYTTASASAAPGQIAPAVITIAPEPAPHTLDAQVRAYAATAQPSRPGAIQVASVQVASVQMAAPPSPPVRHAGRSAWMIQIGAFQAESQARDKLREAQTRNKGLLGNADPFTEKVVKGSTALYRARFAGFDEERAHEACRVLKKSDFACMPLRN
ncbi:D-alanyl-D-alanine carboxypeptidase [Blastochloris sulfoviridis]|uniref:D-alanyl-D-alanine carboxypeptidase n=1 Tax=Blastochloris sulfoviridis TaxID=50712 RepID=UPI001FE45C9A|nr:D-alanyl-D-alanine carboxypeptidase [Blastochloris sulfoviridis]